VPLPDATPRLLSRALDYLDVGVAFETRNYKPDSPPDDILSQRVFFGATLNLQHVLDRALERRTGNAARRTHQIGRSVLEVLSPPYTILPVVDASRTGGRSGDQ
jgi:hypothetical protein